jgi:hypothetical protein
LHSDVDVASRSLKSRTTFEKPARISKLLESGINEMHLASGRANIIDGVMQIHQVRNGVLESGEILLVAHGVRYDLCGQRLRRLRAGEWFRHVNHVLSS